MSRKGKLAEILSKAKHADNPNSYVVGYLDFEIIKEVTLSEFIKISDNFETIPITRIQHIKKGNDVLYSKIVNKKDPEIIGLGFII
jgi:hypothetical protein